VTVLAAIRPDSWNVPVFLHVLGAMLLVGGLVVAFSAQVLAWRRSDSEDTVALARTAFQALVFVVLPAWFLMRAGAEWARSREDVGGDPTWLSIGYITADGSGLLLLFAIVLSGMGARRLARDGSGARLAKAATVLSAIVIVALLLTVWAMTTKPT